MFCFVFFAFCFLPAAGYSCLSLLGALVYSLLVAAGVLFFVFAFGSLYFLFPKVGSGLGSLLGLAHWSWSSDPPVLAGLRY